MARNREKDMENSMKNKLETWWRLEKKMKTEIKNDMKMEKRRGME